MSLAFQLHTELGGITLHMIMPRYSYNIAWKLTAAVTIPSSYLYIALTLSTTSHIINTYKLQKGRKTSIGASKNVFSGMVSRLQVRMRRVPSIPLAARLQSIHPRPVVPSCRCAVLSTRKSNEIVIDSDQASYILCLVPQYMYIPVSQNMSAGG
jgi:hypothetical protein